MDDLPRPRKRRPVPSKILEEADRRRLEYEAGLAPAERILRAYELGRRQRALFWAAKRSQGFTEEEILALYRRDRRR